ncbi:M24 family metallopeptidase [Patescibacteria group bacterium]|nr:M24 family metallopeptidase [Patescibacteria group bacterium]
MIDIKTLEEIKAMREGGRILSLVLFKLLQNIKPGVSELEIDHLAEELILKKGAKPGFKKVKGYKNSICVSTNGVVVHGVPTSYKFKAGDIVGIDCGVFYKGFHTDMAETILVGAEVASKNFRVHNAGNSSSKSNALGANAHSENFESSPHREIQKFLETGKRALNEAIKMAKAGNRVGHISKTIQDIIEAQGYSVVRSLVGHGVGKKLHEEPEVPGFLVGPIEKTPKLRLGMTIAIEAIYNMGKSDVAYANKDGWTIKTADGSTSGLFERTIVIAKEGPVILTN